MESVILKDEEHPLSSPNTATYAAAMTCGGELAPDGYFTSIRPATDGTAAEKRITVWLLRNKELIFQPFPGDKMTTREFISRFSDKAWLAANPDHPITHMAYLLENLNGARDFIKKSQPLLQVCKGKRSAFIRQDETPERKAQLLSLLDR
jgi:hypothetical protein